MTTARPVRPVCSPRSSRALAGLSACRIWSAALRPNARVSYFTIPMASLREQGSRLDFCGLWKQKNSRRKQLEGKVRELEREVLEQLSLLVPRAAPAPVQARERAGCVVGTYQRTVRIGNPLLGGRRETCWSMTSTLLRAASMLACEAPARTVVAQTISTSYTSRDERVAASSASDRIRSSSRIALETA